MRSPSASPAVAFWLVGYAFAVVMASTTLPTPLYPLYQRDLGLSSLLITVVFAVYALGAIAGLLAFGALSDRIGRRRVLLPGIAVSMVGALALLLEGGLALILLGRVLSGVAAGIFAGTATAALVDLAPQGRRGFATLVTVAASIGALGCGALLSGLLAQYGPAPLRLPFAVDLGLLVAATAGLVAVPETVAAPCSTRRRTRRLGVPIEVRGVFARAATAGTCGFAVSGVFSAIAPLLLVRTLHEPSHVLAGLASFLLLGTSAVGQMMIARLPDGMALSAGCGLLIAGVGLLAGAVAFASLACLLVAAVLAGLGLGLAVGAGLDGINRGAPLERRSEAASAFFVSLYVGLVLIVVAVGLGTDVVGLQRAGLAFSAVVGVLVLGVLASLARRAATSDQI